jgi:hypothetical protein
MSQAAWPLHSLMPRHLICLPVGVGTAALPQAARKMEAAEAAKAIGFIEASLAYGLSVNLRPSASKRKPPVPTSARECRTMAARWPARSNRLGRGHHRELHAPRWSASGMLERVRDRPVVLHGVSLAIGSVAPLDRAHLGRLRALACPTVLSVSRGSASSLFRGSSATCTASLCERTRISPAFSIDMTTRYRLRSGS